MDGLRERGIALLLIIVAASLVGLSSAAQNASNASAVNATHAPVVSPARNVSQRWSEDCSPLSHLADRIACRIDEQGNATVGAPLWYVPEDCLQLLSTPAYDSCMQEYRLIQQCRTPSKYSAREACERQALGYSPFAAAAAACGTNTGGNLSACVDAARQHAFTLIKMRMDALIFRASQSIAQGASKTRVAAFVSQVESDKIAFSGAQSIDDRKAAVVDVRDAWTAFVADASSDIASYRVNQALSSPTPTRLPR